MKRRSFRSVRHCAPVLVHPPTLREIAYAASEARNELNYAHVGDSPQERCKHYEQLIKAVHTATAAWLAAGEPGGSKNDEAWLPRYRSAHERAIGELPTTRLRDDWFGFLPDAPIAQR